VRARCRYLPALDGNTLAIRKLFFGAADMKVPPTRRDASPSSILTLEQILAWADAHYQRTGRWPTAESGLVGGAPGLTWQAVNQALVRGNRGLPGDSSLARLLAGRRGRRSKAQAPPLTAAQILCWADLHYARTGRWPTSHSGPVPDAPGENWMAIQAALYAGNRGLPGGETLPGFLRRHRRGAVPGSGPYVALDQPARPLTRRPGDPARRRTGEGG
jgi:hypothetical protein